MVATTETFQIWANHLHEKVIDRDSVKHDPWTVPSPFCSMVYINDVRHLPGIEARALEIVRKLSKNAKIMCSPNTHVLQMNQLNFSLNEIWPSAL